MAIEWETTKQVKRRLIVQETELRRSKSALMFIGGERICAWVDPKEKKAALERELRAAILGGKP